MRIAAVVGVVLGVVSRVEEVAPEFGRRHVLATEPGRPLASVAGPVERWFALGVAAGIVFGAAGSMLRSRSAALRVAAFLPLSTQRLTFACPNRSWICLSNIVSSGIGSAAPPETPS